MVLVIYICLLCFISYFFQKAENNSLKEKPVGHYFVILFFLFLLKVGSAGPVDQQINLVSPNEVYLEQCRTRVETFKLAITCSKLTIKTLEQGVKYASV